MGRKIPGKKHRGVKDPYAQHAKRLDSIKTKINKAPTDPDDQPMPKSLLRLMSWKNKSLKKQKDRTDSKTTNLSQNSKKINKDKLKPKNPVNQLKKIPGESNKSFNIRINEAMKSLKEEKTFDDVIDDLPTEKEKKMMESDEPKVYIQKKGKKRRVNTGEPFLTKSQKRTLKEKLKKEALKQNKQFEQFYAVQKDNVKFGEIVHEPPSLNVKPRKAEKYTTVARPARKDLLLNKLFDKNSQSKVHSSKILKPNIKVNTKKAEGVIDMKGKRKDLPQNVRRKLEETQKEAIEAYRLIKLENMKRKS